EGLLVFVLRDRLVELEALENPARVDGVQHRDGRRRHRACPRLLRVLLRLRLRGESPADGRKERAADGERAVLRARAVDDEPGRRAGARLAEDVLADAAVAVVIIEALPVPLRDAPARELVGFELAESLLLGLLREVE